MAIFLKREFDLLAFSVMMDMRSRPTIHCALEHSTEGEIEVLQIWEYQHAYQELNLTLESGIYGSTFYMLTGFHGFHVTMGAIMLMVIAIRCMRGHFKPEHHFGFEAVAWYWHFVDVVWLGLFLFVYVY